MIQYAFRKSPRVEETVRTIHHGFIVSEIGLQCDGSAEANVVDPTSRPNLQAMHAGPEVNLSLQSAFLCRDDPSINREQELRRILLPALLGYLVFAQR